MPKRIEIKKEKEKPYPVYTSPSIDPKSYLAEKCKHNKRMDEYCAKCNEYVKELE